MSAGREGAALTLVDLPAARVAQRLRLHSAWMGVAFLSSGRRLAVSGGLDNRILLFDAGEQGFALADSIALGPPWSAGGQYPQGHRIDYGPGAIWPTAIAADERAGRLFVLSRFDSSLRVVDLATRAVTRRVALGAVPYACVADPGTGHVLVSLWSAAAIAVVDPDSGRVIGRCAVGGHPTDLALSPRDGRLFVANANDGTVSVLDPASGRIEETLATALSGRAGAGATPDGVALDPTGARLYAADADANALCVFDVSRRGQSKAIGWLPTGWYPTAVRVRTGGALVVANGKGLGSGPSDVAPPDTGGWCGYLGYHSGPRGTLGLLPAPDAAALARGTRTVLAAMPRPRRPAGGPLATHARSPIRHVFYVFRENRTYDQVLGDLPRGDGDSTRCIFGRRVTPNAHALAGEFVLLDRAFCDADGSSDGHNWGMAAIATDYVVKSAGTSPVYDYEGGDDLAYPAAGYLWDACRRAGVSVRSYGEFVFNPDDPRDSVRAGVPGLEGHVAPRYRGYDPTCSDLERYAAWLEEFDRYDRDGGLPALEIIRLPNDHTEGTCSGRPTPRACVAQNDLALGKLVERISHSRYWKQSLVVVVEDDASNGPDHVDAHRTVALLAGPYVRRGVVDHERVTNASLLRTIERALGLAPMSAFDAAATPPYAAFTDTVDARPYACRPAGVDLEEKNLAGAWGQERCDRMNFAVADAAPPDELNEVLWRDARGSAPPPPARGCWLLAATPPAVPRTRAGHAPR